VQPEGARARVVAGGIAQSSGGAQVVHPVPLRLFRPLHRCMLLPRLVVTMSLARQALRVQGARPHQRFRHVAPRNMKGCGLERSRRRLLSREVRQ
jgi:hypothetical protein